MDGIPSSADSATIRLFTEGEENETWSNPALSLWTVSGEWVEGMAWSENTTTATHIRNIGAASDLSWFDIDITDIYNQWTSGELANSGIQLRPLTNFQNVTKFVSSESDDAQHRPILVVDPAASENLDILNVANLMLTSGDASGVTANGNNLDVNPSAYDHLAAGESEVISYSYDIVDSYGGSVAQTATVTISGEDDTPTAASATTVETFEDAVLF